MSRAKSVLHVDSDMDIRGDLHKRHYLPHRETYMANLSRSLKKASVQEQLERRISQLEMFEARATMVLAIYDAIAGEIEAELVKHVADELAKSQAASREDFYKVAKATATVWLQERQMAEEEARLAAAAPSIPSMSVPDAED